VQKKLRRRAGKFVAVFLVILLVGGAAAFIERKAIATWIDSALNPDYAGSGTGSVSIVIKPGDTGESVAKALVAAGVVKDFKTIFAAILKTNPMFYPGTFELNKSMNSLEALKMLQNPDAHVYKKVTIKEGLRISNVLSVLHRDVGIDQSALESAAKDFTSIGVPSSEVSAEGWLFPATYNFDPASDAKTVLATMVERAKQELTSQGVAKKDWHKVLVLASIIQKEARQTPDFYKVSRVFQNRIKEGILLQSDATVSYGSGGTTVTTTDAERAATNGYNTYVKPGLPVGAISGPGALAIEAALKPAKGDWLYFCAVNLKTGETVFSSTQAQHEVAVSQFRKWMRENPGWNG
jgi:UPF0755 protein